MQTEGQIFDRPVEAFMADANVLKWLKPLEDSSSLALESVSPSSAEDGRQELITAVKSALAAWDPNQGPAHEEQVLHGLEKALEAIASRVFERLSDEQKQSLRAQQRLHMGYAYLFVATPDELKLNAPQRQELMDLTTRAATEAEAATRSEMNQVQIRNPQAYLAYKIRKRYEETHKRRVSIGKEFYEKTLSREQQAQLSLSAPVSQP